MILVDETWMVLTNRNRELPPKPGDAIDTTNNDGRNQWFDTSSKRPNERPNPLMVKWWVLYFIYTVLCHIPWFNDVLRWRYGPISHNATGGPATESSRPSIFASPVTCRLKLRVSCDTRGFTLAAIVTIPWKPTMTGGHTFYIIPVRKGYNQFHKPLLGRFMVYWVWRS